ncbi:THAP domain-containing protein 2-like [Achroia grisella]|uniref:THAP domain-containing protein 2-like n=1 Tax=Achroia grisella TaxID=688607 RepID=UPI0027D262A7|nr:THAP domain-containing protein 2-like [Achroia grisella]
MVTCSVIECCTTQRNNPDKLTFHRIPLDVKAQNTWLRLIDRPNWTPTKHACLCSKHFDDKYFRRIGKKRFLMKCAIPTKFIPVKFKPKRTASSYVYRDIADMVSSIPLTSETTSTKQFTSMSSKKSKLKINTNTRKLILKYSKMRQKMIKKDQIIQNLRAQNQHFQNKIISLVSVLHEIRKQINM